MKKKLPQLSKSLGIPFSTTLTPPTKKLLERYCEKNGLRINHFVERAILETLEDDMDREIIQARSQEETVAWKRGA